MIKRLTSPSVRLMVCGIGLAGLAIAAASGCNDYAAMKYPEVSMTITQQPVENTDLDQLSMAFRVDRLVPAPGPLVGANLLPVIFQVNWYVGHSPLGAPDMDSFRRSETFYFYGGSTDQAAFTSTYPYPYKDPSGAPMECAARIFWTDSKGEHQVDTSTISLSPLGD